MDHTRGWLLLAKAGGCGEFLYGDITLKTNSGLARQSSEVFWQVESCCVVSTALDLNTQWTLW